MDFNSDLKFFYNSVTEKPQFYDFNNSDIPSTFHTTLKGFEVDVNASLNDLFSGTPLNNIDFHLNYTYLDHDPDNPERRLFVPRHYGSVYSIFDFKDDWFSTISYYGNSAMGKKKESFDAYELGLGKTIKLTSSTLTLSGKFAYHPDKVELLRNRTTIDSSSSFFLNVDFKL